MSFACPRCGKRSANPTDAEQQYCGACHSFIGEQAPLCATLPPLPMRQVRDLLAAVDHALLPSIYAGWSLTDEGFVPDDPDRVAELTSLRDTVALAMAGAAPCRSYG